MDERGILETRCGIEIMYKIGINMSNHAIVLFRVVEEPYNPRKRLELFSTLSRLFFFGAAR